MKARHPVHREISHTSLMDRHPGPTPETPSTGSTAGPLQKTQLLSSSAPGSRTTGDLCPAATLEPNSAKRFHLSGCPVWKRLALEQGRAFMTDLLHPGTLRLWSSDVLTLSALPQGKRLF